MVTTGVSIEAGGRTTLTRSPPGSRVSTIGLARFTSRPAPDTIRWMMSSSSFSLEEVRGDRSTTPARSTNRTSQALIMISDTVSSFRYSSRMPSPRKLPYSVSTNRASSSAEKSCSGFWRRRIFRMSVRRDSSSIAERPSVRYSSRRTLRRTSCSLKVSSMSASLLCEPFVEPLHGRGDRQFRNQVFGVRDAQLAHAAQFDRELGL